MNFLWFFWGTLHWVPNLWKHENGYEKNADDPEEQCQLPVEGDLGDQLVAQSAKFFIVRTHKIVTLSNLHHPS